MTEFAVKDGLGCDMSHFAAAELQGKSCPTSTSMNTRCV